jgi:hypothetical protein
MATAHRLLALPCWATIVLRGLARLPAQASASGKWFHIQQIKSNFILWVQGVKSRRRGAS